MATEAVEKVARYLELPRVRSLFSETEFSELRGWEKTLKALEDLKPEDLQQIARDPQNRFLVRRIAEMQLGFSEKNKVIQSQPQNFWPVAGMSPWQREERQQQALLTYGTAEYRLYWEHQAVFGQAIGLTLFLKAIVRTQSEESLPLLEDMYKWKQYRVEEAGLALPVRQMIRDVLFDWVCSKTLFALARIWDDPSNSPEEKELIVTALCTKPKWHPFIEKNKASEDEVVRRFQDTVNEKRVQLGQSLEVKVERLEKTTPSEGPEEKTEE
ncbi:MAG: hypothetical protein L6R28_23970 [Planctomycetes bacterium]|nr:hypothetical protein [Planctomycetota bacterium]